MLFRACSLQNEVGDRPIFYISDVTNSLSFNCKIFRKKINVRKFLWLPIVFFIRARWFRKSRDGASFQTLRSSRARNHAAKCRQTWRPKFIYRRFMGLFRFQNIYRPNRRPYFSLLDLKEKCSKIGHTSLTRFFFLSNAPMTPEGHWYACALGRLEIVWRHKHTNDEKKVLTFLVFPTMKFCESLHASWYRCLLQYIIFWQIFIYFFK